ncbi:coatomer subunit beta'-1-like [Iris pallida]|uniref:Coatomer subunit beta'-1-like n=1 Tax=Iris pallida TaxID=29817 RepID=A0AAX6E6Y0_IRIPA|nr:coatomer subunit beta'-1-like [Iris pallida]
MQVEGVNLELDNGDSGHEELEENGVEDQGHEEKEEPVEVGAEDSTDGSVLVNGNDGDKE